MKKYIFYLILFLYLFTSNYYIFCNQKLNSDDKKALFLINDFKNTNNISNYKINKIDNNDYILKKENGNRLFYHYLQKFINENTNNAINISIFIVIDTNKEITNLKFYDEINMLKKSCYDYKKLDNLYYQVDEGYLFQLQSLYFIRLIKSELIYFLTIQIENNTNLIENNFNVGLKNKINFIIEKYKNIL